MLPIEGIEVKLQYTLNPRKSGELGAQYTQGGAGDMPGCDLVSVYRTHRRAEKCPRLTIGGKVNRGQWGGNGGGLAPSAQRSHDG